MNRETLDNISNKTVELCFISHSFEKVGVERTLLELVKTLKEKEIYSVVILPSYGLLSDKIKSFGINFLVNKYW